MDFGMHGAMTKTIKTKKKIWPHIGMNGGTTIFRCANKIVQCPLASLCLSVHPHIHLHAKTWFLMD
jgi:hypothetical protein